jgi:hypothetical protein
MLASPGPRGCGLAGLAGGGRRAQVRGGGGEEVVEVGAAWDAGGGTKGVAKEGDEDLVGRCAGEARTRYGSAGGTWGLGIGLEVRVRTSWAAAQARLGRGTGQPGARGG